MDAQKEIKAEAESGYAMPEVPREKWVNGLEEESMPEWGNVRGTLPNRIREKMGVQDVIEAHVSEDDLVLDLGSSEGYTSIELEAMTGADVIGMDMPGAFRDGGKSYGGHSPEYVGGLSPDMPLKEGSVDGITAFNSASYLVRNIGALAEEINDDAGVHQRDRIRRMSSATAASDLLEDFDRVLGEEGYVLLAEQTDESYLLLEKSDSGTAWEVSDYDSFPGHSGDAFHTRYRPWVETDEVSYGQDM